MSEAYRFWFLVEVEGAMFPFKTLEGAERWALQEGWGNYTIKALQPSESDDLVEFYREQFAGLSDDLVEFYREQYAGLPFSRW